MVVLRLHNNEGKRTSRNSIFDYPRKRRMERGLWFALAIRLSYQDDSLVLKEQDGLD
jgi:hypothetical protein